MATKIVTKNSSTASAVPTASDLVQGELAVNVADKRLFTEDNAGAIVELGTNPSGNVTFQDNGKAIFGAGDDLQVYHDGSNSYVKDVGTGTLNLQGSTQVLIAGANGTVGVQFIEGAGVNLRHNNSQKLATTSSGIDVTGTATMDGLTVSSDSGGIVYLQDSNATATYSISELSNNGGNFGIQTRDSSGTFVSTDYQIVKNASGADYHRWFTQGAERMRIDSSGNLLVGKTSASIGTVGCELRNDGYILGVNDGDAPLFLNRKSSDGDIAKFYKDGAVVGSIGTAGGDFTVNAQSLGVLQVGGASKYAWTDSFIYPTSNGTRDIGTSSFRFKDLYLSGSVQMGGNLDVVGQVSSYDNVGASYGTMNFRATDFVYKNAGGSERMRIDSSGNLLVGKSGSGSALVGFQAGQDGFIAATRASGQPLVLNRTTNDGIIADFRKDSTTVGSIGSYSSSYLTVGNNTSGLAFLDAGSPHSIRPHNVSTNVSSDDLLDLGATGARFNDIYATNGTIQTSDRNEKQDIAELSEAEQRVAVAAKGLLRKFRWKNSVAEKGDDARIHFGIIAQDLQAAFEAEGLDAGDYAMFISTTWTDEETNEEKTRMGVRYSELLAFIISAI